MQAERVIRRKWIPHQCHFGYLKADEQDWIWRFGPGKSAWYWLPEQDTCWTVYLGIFLDAS